MTRAVVAGVVMTGGLLGAAFSVGAGSASATASLCDSVAGNIVTNCGFETGNLTGWTYSNPSQSNAGGNVYQGNPHTGTYAYADGAVNAPDFLSQTLTQAQPSTTYNVTFYADDRNEPSTGNSFVATVSGTTSGTTTLVTDSGSGPIGPSYTQISGSFTTPSTITSAPVLTFTIQNDGSFYDLDDVLITSQTPAAATLATPTVSLSASPSGGSSAGQSVTLTATVAGTTGGSAPTGTVGFFDNSVGVSNACSAVTLVPGSGSSSTATCTTSSLPQGQNGLQADYSGDGSYAPGQSSTLSYPVGAATSSSPFTVTQTLSATHVDRVHVHVTTSPAQPGETVEFFNVSHGVKHHFGPNGKLNSHGHLGQNFTKKPGTYHVYEVVGGVKSKVQAFTVLAPSGR